MTDAPKPRREPKLGAVVSAWVSASAYDRIIKAANAREVSVSKLVREILEKSAKGRPPV
jgi:hypothetical protein